MFVTGLPTRYKLFQVDVTVRGLGRNVTGDVFETVEIDELRHDSLGRRGVTKVGYIQGRLWFAKVHQGRLWFTKADYGSIRQAMVH